MTKQNLIDSGFLEFSPNYFISEYGLIFSLKSDKFLKPTTNPNGWLQKSASKENEKKYITTSKLLRCLEIVMVIESILD